MVVQVMVQVGVIFDYMIMVVNIGFGIVMQIFVVDDLFDGVCFIVVLIGGVVVKDCVGWVIFEFVFGVMVILMLWVQVFVNVWGEIINCVIVVYDVIMIEVL